MRLFFCQTLTDYHSWNRHLGFRVSRHLFNIQHTRCSFEPSPKAKACNLPKLDLWLLFGPCEAAMMNLFLWCEGFTPLSHSLCIELQLGVGRWHRAKRNHTASRSTAVVFLRAGGPSVVHKDTDCCLLCTTTLMDLLMTNKAAWRDHSLVCGYFIWFSCNILWRRSIVLSLQLLLLTFTTTFLFTWNQDVFGTNSNQITD